MPPWFDPTTFQTLGKWIVSNFEKAIWTRFLQKRKNSGKNYSSFEALDLKEILSYKKSLTEFWKGVDKSKKKKVIGLFETSAYLCI